MACGTSAFGYQVCIHSNNYMKFEEEKFSGHVFFGGGGGGGGGVGGGGQRRIHHLEDFVPPLEHFK